MPSKAVESSTDIATVKAVPQETSTSGAHEDATPHDNGIVGWLDYDLDGMFLDIF